MCKTRLVACQVTYMNIQTRIQHSFICEHLYKMRPCQYSLCLIVCGCITAVTKMIEVKLQRPHEIHCGGGIVFYQCHNVL